MAEGRRSALRAALEAAPCAWAQMERRVTSVATARHPDVPGIVGFAKACEILEREGAEEAKRIGALRDRLYPAYHELDR